MRRVLLVLLLAACSSGVRSDFEAICNAHELSGASGYGEVCTRSDVVARWLLPRVQTDEAKAFLRSAFKLREPEARRQAIVEEAARHGVSPCHVVAEDLIGCL
jgi:hypothetical protein